MYTVSPWKICSYCTIECVLLLYNVFSHYRMCSLTIECHMYRVSPWHICRYDIECVLLLQNVFSYYRMCSLTIGYLRGIYAGMTLYIHMSICMYVYTISHMCKDTQITLHIQYLIHVKAHTYMCVLYTYVYDIYIRICMYMSRQVVKTCSKDMQ